MSASSAFVLLWAGWASLRLVHAVHGVSPSSGVIPKAPLTDARRGFPRGEISDSFGAGDSRHAISGEIARRLFGGRASHAGSSIEGRQPEPSSSVAGCGSRSNGPGLGGEDRGPGSH